MLIIVEQLTHQPDRPFQILETYQSCDGPRTRVTENRFKTFDEANAFRIKHNATEINE